MVGDLEMVFGWRVGLWEIFGMAEWYIIKALDHM